MENGLTVRQFSATVFFSQESQYPETKLVQPSVYCNFYITQLNTATSASMWHVGLNIKISAAVLFSDIIRSAFVEFNCETTSVIDEEVAELKIFDTANTVRLNVKIALNIGNS